MLHSYLYSNNQHNNLPTKVSAHHKHPSDSMQLKVNDILHTKTDIDRKNRASCQLGNVFRVIYYEFAGPNCLASVLKYVS